MSPLGIPSNREGMIQPSTTNQPPKFTPLTLENPSTAKLTTKHTSPITNKIQQNQTKIYIYHKSSQKKERFWSHLMSNTTGKKPKRELQEQVPISYIVGPSPFLLNQSTKGASFDEKEKNPSLQIEPRKSNKGNPHLLIPFFLSGVSQGELSTSLTKFFFYSCSHYFKLI